MSGTTGPAYYGGDTYSVPGPGYNPGGGGYNWGALAGLTGSLTSAFSQWNQANMMEDAAKFNNGASLFESQIFSNYSRMSLMEAKAQRSLAELNAMSFDTEAEGVKAQTAQATTKLRKEGSKVQGSQVSRYAKSGVEMGGGTPALVVKETSEDIESDLANILAAGRLEEGALRLQGRMTRAQGELAGLKSENQAWVFDLQGKNALASMAWKNYVSRFQAWTQRFGAMNTLLTGLSNWQMPKVNRTP